MRRIVFCAFSASFPRFDGYVSVHPSQHKYNKCGDGEEGTDNEVQDGEECLEERQEAELRVGVEEHRKCLTQLVRLFVGVERVELVVESCRYCHQQMCIVYWSAWKTDQLGR